MQFGAKIADGLGLRIWRHNPDRTCCLMITYGIHHLMRQVSVEARVSVAQSVLYVALVKRMIMTIARSIRSCIQRFMIILEIPYHSSAEAMAIFASMVV